ncbi:MAG: insulinase family protein [Clostridiales bacterium]|jgi:Zn-dependent M16 (insulinase) family peptidase|nr:insulinase family protein [Clostridiales bacterium]
MPPTIKHCLFLLICFSFFRFHPTETFSAPVYEVVSQLGAPQYDGRETHYRHISSGASVLYIENADTERAFTIGFKTRTRDDTGVNHIIEHSLLSGSTHYESKPFTWLLNHSGATFLNAMTFHDFTVYTLASRDETEYRKLITAYMNDIFYPAAILDEGIFRREGWRLGEDGYNGTVYNEMKGVYSTDDAFLRRAAYGALFPDGEYCFDSGGLPEVIPSLTYEKFKMAYDLNYRPENALIVLYGKQDINSVLALLDKDYLSQIPRRMDNKDHLPISGCKVESSPPARWVYASYPAKDGISSMAISYAACDRSDPASAARMEILADLLDDRNAAVFGDIIKRGLAARVHTEYNSMMEQCVLSIVLKGIDTSKAKEIKAMADTCLQRAADAGFDEKRVAAVLHQYTYNLAAVKNEAHRGIDAGIEAMSAFVYGQAVDESAYRKAIKTFDQAFIKEAVENCLLNNPRTSAAVLSPEQPPAGQAASTRPAQKVIAYTEPREMPFPIPDDQKDTAPLLKLKARQADQIRAVAPPTPPAYRTDSRSGVKLIHTNLNTHGVSSIHLYMGASALPQSLIGYAQILAHILADEGVLPLDASIGEIQGYMSADKTMGYSEFTPRLHLTLRGLDSDIPSMVKTYAALLDPGASPDKRIVRGYLTRVKLAMDSGFENQMPLFGCLARLSDAGLYEYEINGLMYYQFVTGLLSDFDHVWPDISNNLAAVKKTLLDDNDAVFSFTGSEDAYKMFRKHSGVLAALFPESNKEASCPAGAPAAYNIPAPAVSVFPAALSQTYAVIQGGDLKKAGSSYNGAFLVTASLLNYDYLWPLVRDEGGAYGVNVSVLHDGPVLLRSYRDPHKEKTFGVYKGIPAFLRQPPDEEGFAGVRAHVLAEWDEQFQPHRLWDYGAETELGIINMDVLNRVRFEIIYSQPGDLKYDAEIWDKILKQGVTAVGGKAE